jgi:hypothetical protein
MSFKTYLHAMGWVRASIIFAVMDCKLSVAGLALDHAKCTWCKGNPIISAFEPIKNCLTFYVLRFLTIDSIVCAIWWWYLAFLAIHTSGWRDWQRCVSSHCTSRTTLFLPPRPRLPRGPPACTSFLYRRKGHNSASDRFILNKCLCVIQVVWKNTDMHYAYIKHCIIALFLKGFLDNCFEHCFCFIP